MVETTSLTTEDEDIGVQIKVPNRDRHLQLLGRTSEDAPVTQTREIESSGPFTSR